MLIINGPSLVCGVCPRSLVWFELWELSKGRSGVALTQFSSSNSSNGSNCVRSGMCGWDAKCMCIRCMDLSLFLWCNGCNSRQIQMCVTM